MIFEYAIDPAVLSDVNSCRTVIESFKPELGRLIADAPRRWVREANQAINSIPHEQCQPIMKKTIKSGLKKLLDQSLCANRTTGDWDRDGLSWVEYIANCNREYPFAAVITRDEVNEPVKTYSISNLFLNAPECWNHSLQVNIRRQAQDIANVMMPLLVIAREIHLIDMHIYPNEAKYRNVLLEIISRCEKYNFGRGVKKLVIHTSDHRQDMQTSLQRNILPALPEGFELVCHQWPQAIEHDRFVITDVAGLSFGHGLDEGRRGMNEEVMVSLINDNQRRRLISKFSGVPTTSWIISN